MAPPFREFVGAMYLSPDTWVKDISQLIRYATILLDISEESGEAFDELLLERNARGAIWLHFAVRQAGNRRRIHLLR